MVSIQRGFGICLQVLKLSCAFRELLMLELVVLLWSLPLSNRFPFVSILLHLLITHSILSWQRRLLRMPPSTDPPAHGPRTLTKRRNGSSEITKNSNKKNPSCSRSLSKRRSHSFFLRRRSNEDLPDRRRLHRHSSFDDLLVNHRLVHQPTDITEELSPGGRGSLVANGTLARLLGHSDCIQLTVRPILRASPISQSWS